MNKRVKAILNFWFVKSSSEEHFKKNNTYDQKIKNLFENDYKKAINNNLEGWQDDPKSCLALIILLDQFSRNLYRNNPLSFAYDKKTILIVNKAIKKGYLENLNVYEKFFLILPLIHSEKISDHISAHKLSKSYLNLHPQFENIKKQFVYHTIAIKRFGRYPHRNKILGRISNNEEIQFLSKKNSSW